MANLYQDPLSTITFQDVAAFLTTEPRPREGLRLDFKQTWAKSIIFDVCAFANTAGGLIIVGVPEQGPKEPGHIEGVDERSVSSGMVANQCQTGIYPSYVPEWTSIAIPEHPGKVVVLIRVDARTAPRPVWNPEKGVLVRRDDQCRPADLDTLRSLFNPVPVISPSDATFRETTGKFHMRNADSQAWLSLAIQYPHPFPMDGPWKQAVTDLVLQFFGRPFARVERRILTSYLGYTSNDVPKQTLAVDGLGILDWGRQVPGDPLALQDVIEPLGRGLRWLAHHPRLLCDPTAELPVVVALSNLPREGVSVQGLINVEPLGNSRPWGHTCQQSYVLGPRPRDWVDLVLQFASQLLSEEGYVDHDGPLRGLRIPISRAAGTPPM